LELLKAGFVFDEATGRFFQFEPGELEAMLGETEAEPLAVANSCWEVPISVNGT
jgi:hypothetical protein